MRFTTKVLPSRSGNLGILTLNNPKPLHALTLDMIYFFQDILQTYYKDDTMVAILMKSSKDTKVPAFCAGGDVKQVYLSGIKPPSTIDNNNNNYNNNGKDVQHGQGIPGLDTSEFFRQEYYVNHMIATSPKPHIALWDGIVMGGGAGISVHGQYRVATENTIFAMPETAIGLFPDVGSLYWMNQTLKDSIATYLALTGTRLKAADLIDTGIATHYVPTNKLDDLEAALVLASKSLKPTESMSNIVAPILMSHHQPPPGQLTLDKRSIEKVFSYKKSLEDIVETLKSMDNTEFGKTTLEILYKMSPTSMKVTLEALKRSENNCNSITDEMKMEYRLSQSFMREGSDFYEGIRSVLIDKDNKPIWNPSKIENVTTDMVESYFEPIQYEWEIPPEFIF